MSLHSIYCCCYCPWYNTGENLLLISRGYKSRVPYLFVCDVRVPRAAPARTNDTFSYRQESLNPATIAFSQRTLWQRMMMMISTKFYGRCRRTSRHRFGLHVALPDKSFPMMPPIPRLKIATHKSRLCTCTRFTAKVSRVDQGKWFMHSYFPMLILAEISIV